MQLYKAHVTPNGDENLSAWCVVAAKYDENIIFASYSVHVTLLKRPYGVYGALTAHTNLLQRANGTLTARKHHLHRAGSVKCFFLFIKFEQPIFAK